MKKHTFLNTIISIIIGIVLALIVKKYILLIGYIPSSSMEDTLKVGDFIIANRLAYIFTEPQRGDIICFNHLKYIETKNNIENLEQYTSDIYIKRVIGLPGEHIEINENQIIIDGIIYNEDYIKDYNWGNGNYIFDVPENSFLLLGDNRNASYDARYWDNSYVNKEDIVAKYLYTIKHIDKVE